MSLTDANRNGPGAGDAPTAEHLVDAMSGHEQAEHDAEKQDGDLRVVHGLTLSAGGGCGGGCGGGGRQGSGASRRTGQPCW